MTQINESMVDVLDDWFDAQMEGVHTCLPAVIETYDPKKRLARVKPRIRPMSRLGEVQEILPIDNVPVIFPSTSEFGMTFPLKKGDGVMLLFAETGIGGWINGNSDTPADDESRFSLTDAIAIPGLFQSSQQKDVGHNADDFVIFYKGSKIVIDKSKNVKIDGAQVNLQSGTQGAARIGDDVTVAMTPTDIQALAVALLATGAFTPTGTAPTPPPTPVPITGSKIASGSSKVVIG